VSSERVTDQLKAARALRSAIDANACQAGDAPVPPATVEALSKAGLWGLMCPKEVGGSELPILDVMDIFAEVARADPSAGWCLMAGASTVAYFGSYSPDSFVDVLFRDGIPLAAGQFAPNGVGVREGDAYRLTGNYQFGSGIDYADWVGAGFIVPPPEGSDAPAEYRFALMPKSQVELRGGWDVLGLQSTSSQDYSIDDVLVPEEATFLFAAPTRRRGGAVYELGVLALTAAGHAGFAVGVARRVIDELMATAKTKVRMGAAKSFADMERSVLESEKVDVERINVVRQATVHVTQEAADIARQAYLLAGTTALRDGPMQRCFRDIHAASQHFFASPASTLDMARDLMSHAADSALDT